MPDRLARLGQSALAALFGEPCLLCREPVNRQDPVPGLCRHCLSQLPWRSDFRLQWPEDAFRDLFDPFASDCDPAAAHRVRANCIMAACHYQPPINKGLLALKFGDASEWQRPLASILNLTLQRADLASFDAVVAVPLHPLRLKSRGYNQAGLLASVLARQLDLPDWSVWLERTRETRRQSEQASRADRLVNLAGAFRWSGPDCLRQARLLLVDDVLTTGATLAAAAEPLFRRQSHVTGLVVASDHAANPGETRATRQHKFTNLTAGSQISCHKVY